jgi:hypothetical protein
MAWSESGAKPKEIKFLVDLQKHTYISDKSHQEIIDLAGLNPAGYDNYLKGWVKADGTIKLWVETIEDVVFRYWDQIKLGFKTLVARNLTGEKARIYAIVNRVERFAGTVKDFMRLRSKETYFEDKLGYVVHFAGRPTVSKGAEVLLLVNWRVAPDRYLMAGTRGRVRTGAGARAKSLRVRWQKSVNGVFRRQGGVERLTDRRLIAVL